MIHKHSDKAIVCYAPFSQEELKAINEYQLSAPYPYVCKTCGGVQLGKKEGMTCVESHGLMTVISFLEREREMA